MDDKISDYEMQQICAFLSDVAGLSFPSSRLGELRRGIVAAAKEFGHDSPMSYARKLMTGASAQRELQSLLDNLTVGETYFFRDIRSFDLLENQILPQLIRTRRNTDRRLRIWSTACCTGEEAYSIAILLRQMIPDWQHWNITLLATDINSRFLQKATTGIFGPWSFRDAPSWLQKRYFRPVADGKFEILPELKRMVRFEHLNLASAAYPSCLNDTNSMDLIFCRNVLMYFTTPQAQGVIKRLYDAQAEDGWLILGPSELPETPCHPYVARNYQGTIVYQKGGALPPSEPEPIKPPAPARMTAIQLPPVVVDEDKKPRKSVVAQSFDNESPQPAILNRQAVSLANQGKLSEALNCCGHWIAADRLNVASHYLQAVILQEQGEFDRAIRSLRTALYLDPGFVPAHFALGSIAHKRNNMSDADKHLRNVKKLLRHYQPQELLPEFEGVTAGRLIQLVDSLMEKETAA